MSRKRVALTDVGFWFGVTLLVLSTFSVLFIFGGSGQHLDTSNWLDYPLIVLAVIFRWTGYLFACGFLLVCVFGYIRQRGN